MNYVSDFVIWILSTSLIGSLTFGVWWVLRYLLRDKNVEHIIYYLLKAVILFYLLPILQITLLLSSYDLDGTTTGKFFARTAWIEGILCVLGIVWLAGACNQIEAYVRAYRALKWIEETCIPCEKERKEILAAICRDLGIKARIELLEGEDIPSPYISGVFRPKIFLPDLKLSETDLRAALTHELIHFRHKDVLVQMVVCVVCCLHWWNPLTVRLQRANKTWSEYYTDYRTCAVLGNVNSYITSLLEIVIAINQSISFSTVQLCEDKNTVLERVERMQKRKLQKKMSRWAAVSWMMVFLLTGSTTVYAAGTAVVDGYERLYDATVEEIIVPNDLQEELPVFTENAYADPDLIIEEAEESVLRGSNVSIDWTIKAHVRKQTAKFYMSAGSEIYISVGGDPSTSNMKVGIWDPDDVLHYVYDSGDISRTFSLDQSGYYRVFVENDSDVTVNVVGYYSKR